MLEIPCMQTLTNTHTHSIISQEIGSEPKVWSKDVVVVNFAWCFRKTAHVYGFCSHLSPRQAAKTSHTHTQTGEKPISFHFCSTPVLPTALLQPIIIDDLFYPEEGDRSKGPSFDLFSLNVKRLWLLLPASMPTQTVTYMHTRVANPRNHSHPHITTALDSHVGLDISSFGSV